MQVIIAEKPSVAREIAAIVGATNRKDGFIEGNGYAVTWAFGHLVGLAMPQQYGIAGFRRENLPILPSSFILLPRQVREGKEYKADPGVVKQLGILRELFGMAERIIVATDAGREGELIFRYIYSYLECRTPFVRLWISSLTDRAIREGLQHLRPGNEYDNLYLSAKARSEADWIVGINASQALAVAAGRGVWSLGRVQTPTLAIICSRYLENKAFKPATYFRLKLSTAKEDTECTAPQKLDTFGVFFMKYNYEIRLKAVKLVLEGGLSVREAGCHLGCGRSQVHLWVTLFERHGLTGLKLRHGSYSAEFKLSVLKHMHQNHLSLLETAVHFGIPGPFVIRQWERLYQNQGAEGLRRKPQRRRPAMSKSKTKKVKLKTTPHEELLKELEYLRAENAYLKKLQALVEERIVRESGKEPKPSKD